MQPITTRTVDVVDDYHGTPVADPYRWLEDAADPEVLAWTAAQTARTRAWLDAAPARARIERRLRALWDYPRYSVPDQEGGRTFYLKNDGLQDQSVLYVQDGAEAEPAVLLDPNTLSEDGTVALTSWAASRDGRLLAYTLAESGSDWQTVRVRDVATRADLPDLLRRCRFTSLAWRPDGAGFYYSRFPEPGSVPPEDENHYNRVYYHATGAQQADDTLVYERPDAKELLFAPEVTRDGRYLVITASAGTDPRTRVYYRALDAAGPLVPLLDDGDAKYWFIDNDGPRFLMQTDLDAPCDRVVAIDTRGPDRAAWQEVLPEGADPLAVVVAAGDALVAVTLRDASHRVTLYGRDGTLRRELALPGIGSIEGVSGKPGDTELFLGFTSFLYPTTPFRLDLADPNAPLVPLHPSGIDFDPSRYETRQVFVTSQDGTRVPLFLTHRRGLALDGDNPTLLYGYGGFKISLTPSFAIHRLAWLEAGGVFALANLRGGDEYGEAWHRAGMLERKQNVFDDFIACAEWLVASGHTCRARLAINGGSNGGLLVAACLTQRPELFSAVVCEVPVADMLRYHTFTIGHFWVAEYGSAAADPAQFATLRAYSPLHNVRPGTAYPPVLITSADTDDRVVPAHAKKFAAALQAAQAGDAPILLRVEMKAGHGLGKPTSKVIDERADVYAFLYTVLGVDG